MKYLAAFLFILLSYCAQAQNESKRANMQHDSINLGFSKTDFSNNRQLINDSLRLKNFKPDPIRVVWMAAIIPGYGQILNRKYWKLPIVYGGFLGCAYAISWNSSTYQTYLTAYKDITDTDPTTNSFLQLIPSGRTVDSYGGISVFTSTLKSKQDVFRRYKDLSIIATVAFYALTIVDAYVDAQLYDFDISPNLSLHLQPALLQHGSGSSGALGMQCSIRLR